MIFHLECIIYISLLIYTFIVMELQYSKSLNSDDNKHHTTTQ